MQQYMLIYKGGDPAWHSSATEAEIELQMGQWEAWMTALSEKGQLVSGGDPLHYAGKRVTPAGSVTDIATSELNELVSGYSIISADSLDAAVEIAKNCPIMQHPDIVVEVREIQQM